MIRLWNVSRGSRDIFKTCFRSSRFTLLSSLISDSLASDSRYVALHRWKVITRPKGTSVRSWFWWPRLEYTIRGQQGKESSNNERKCTGGERASGGRRAKRRNGNVEIGGRWASTNCKRKLLLQKPRRPSHLCQVSNNLFLFFFSVSCCCFLLDIYSRFRMCLKVRSWRERK